MILDLPILIAIVLFVSVEIRSEFKSKLKLIFVSHFILQRNNISIYISHINHQVCQLSAKNTVVVAKILVLLDQLSAGLRDVYICVIQRNLTRLWQVLSIKLENYFVRPESFFKNQFWNLIIEVKTIIYK